MAEKMYTYTTESGRQVEVTEKEYKRLNPQAEFADRPTVESPGENEINLLHNSAYIAAHGPAEPIRGRQMFPEQTHPGIALAAALGVTPDTFPVPAPGRTVQAVLPDATQNVTPEQLRAQLEEVDSPLLDDADDAVNSVDVSSPDARDDEAAVPRSDINGIQYGTGTETAAGRSDEDAGKSNPDADKTPDTAKK